jgi:hypothetical protein
MPAEDDDKLKTALLSNRERDLRPLGEEVVEKLSLDPEQMETVEFFLSKAWFFGIKTSYKVIVESKLGDKEAGPVVLSMQDEFQEIIERCGDELRTTVSTTIEVFKFLGEAWVRGVNFWEVESTAMLIESQEGGLDEALERLLEE